MIFFLDLIDWVAGLYTESIGYQTACPTNTPVRSVFFEDLLFGRHGGGGGLCISSNISTYMNSMALYSRSRSPCLARAASCVPLQGCC